MVSENLAYWHFISSNKFFVLLMFEVIQTGVLHSYNGRIIYDSYNGRIIYDSYNGRIIYDSCNGRIIFRTNLKRCLLGERELAVPCSLHDLLSIHIPDEPKLSLSDEVFNFFDFAIKQKNSNTLFVFLICLSLYLV